MTTHRVQQRTRSSAAFTRTAVPTLLAVVGAFVLAACGPEANGSGTTLPTPTEEPSAGGAVAAIRQVSVNEAKQRYVAFNALSDEIASETGREGFIRMLEDGFLGTPSIREKYQKHWDLFAQQKLTQSGAREVASMTVTDFQGDPEMQPAQTLRIRMDACLDTSAVDVVNDDGESVLLEGYPTRLIHDVLMQRQPGGHWTVNEATNTEKEC